MYYMLYITIKWERAWDYYKYYKSAFNLTRPCRHVLNVPSRPADGGGGWRPSSKTRPTLLEAKPPPSLAPPRPVFIGDDGTTSVLISFVARDRNTRLRRERQRERERTERRERKRGLHIYYTALGVGPELKLFRSGSIYSTWYK